MVSQESTTSAPTASTLIINSQLRLAYSSHTGGWIDNANMRVGWTVDEWIGSSTNYHTLTPTVQCPPTDPNCTNPEKRVVFDISRFCDGQTHEISARLFNIFNGNGEFFSYLNPGFYGGRFSCTGGGDSLPAPNELPVIFVPGIMGSIMKGPYEGQTAQYWTNFAFTGNPAVSSVRNLTLDSSSPYFRAGIYASDVVRSVSIFNRPLVSVYEPLLTNLAGMGFNRPYDVQRHFEQNLGCNYSLKNSDVTQVPNLFVFPYDWRQDNHVTAGKFKNYVQCVQQLYPPGTKVNIIAHSMGGLVVRRYILRALENQEPTRIGKVITIASPFLGAPDATYKLYTGGDLDQSSIAVTPSSIHFLASHMSSLHQLLPSRKYHELRQGIIVERGDVDGNGIADEKYDFNRIVQLLNIDYPATLPGTRGASFHDFAGQDDWRSDQSGIKYFHIMGQQKQRLTTDGLYVSYSTRCRVTGNRLTGCFKNRRYTPKKGPGDQTVPTLSTSMGWAGLVQSADLAPQGMRIFIRNSLDANGDKNAAEHTKLTQDERVRDLIASFLGVGQEPPYSNELFEISRPGSGAQSLGKAYSIDSEPSFYLTIAGQTEISVRDQIGNTAAIENGFLRNDVPRLNSYEMIASDTAMLTFSTNDSYTVEFLAGTTPIEIELIKGIGNEVPVAAIRYNNLDLLAGTRVRLTFSQGTSTEVRVDNDNDGTFETLVSPTVNLSGVAAGDYEPPAVTMNIIAEQGNTATVSIGAMDVQSGVNMIWYSLDGQSFDQYVSPFPVTLSANPLTIEAFAYDNAANRSGLISKTVSLSTSVVPIAECIEFSEGVYRAWFGYQNSTSAVVSIPAGANNMMLPLPGNKGQVTTFQAGSVTRAFSVSMREKRVEWRLQGNDGLLRSARASIASTPRCK